MVMTAKLGRMMAHQEESQNAHLPTVKECTEKKNDFGG